jgi:hypothetical protein
MLPTSSQETLIQDRVKISTSQVNGSSVSSGTRSDDDDFVMFTTHLCTISNQKSMFYVLALGAKKENGVFGRRSCLRQVQICLAAADRNQAIA